MQWEPSLEGDMRIKDIAKKARRANFSHHLSTSKNNVQVRFERPWWLKYQECVTEAEKLRMIVELLETAIKEEGHFPNWSACWRSKDRIWKRACRIVNSKKK